MLYAAHLLGDHARPVEFFILDGIQSFFLNPTLRRSAAQFFYYRKRKDPTLLAQVHAWLPTGQSALQFACSLGLTKTVEALISKNEMISAADDQGRSPLHSAASYGRCDVMRLLIDHNAGIDLADREGWTPLFWAMFKGHVAGVQILLECNASTQAPDTSGWTVLHWAAYKGDDKMVKLLMDSHRRSTDEGDGDGSQPHRKRHSAHGEIGTRDERTTAELKPLFLALDQQNSEALEVLISCHSNM